MRSLMSGSVVASSVKKLALAALLVPTVLSAQRAPAEPFPRQLDRYLAQVLADWKIPGIAVAVVRNDSVLVARGYGVRKLGEPALVDGHTVFDVASLAKSFTATAVATLVDRGLISWDDPVRRHLPHLVLPNDDLTATATMRDFLSHGTGLDAANMMWVPTVVDRNEVLRRMRYVRVLQPPRQSVVYSNIGYAVAGEAAAAAAGTSFEDLLRDQVVRPLRFSETTWTYEQAADMPNVSASHATIGGRQRPIRREVQRQSIAPAAAVQSSVSDLTRWMRLHLNNGVLDGVRYVSDSAMREMHALQTRFVTTPEMRAARLVQDTVAGYGMGWQVMDYRGHPLLWHSGNGDGQIAWMALLPRDRLGVVVLVNTWAAPMVHGALISRILDTYLGVEPLRDWAGEALARLPGMVAAGESAYRALVGGKSDAGPPRPLASYAGRYDEPLFGPVIVRTTGSGLEMQMGEGQKADLEHHHDDTFLVQWRDELFHEHFTTRLTFETAGDSVASLSMRLNRDQITARRPGLLRAGDAPGLVWQTSWPGTQMAVVSGNPFGGGPFAFRFRMPDQYWICPHTHPITAEISVVSGTFLVGMGTALDTARARVLGAGQQITVTPGMTHYEGSRGETVIEIRGTGPWGITFVDPRYDPGAAAPLVCGK